MLPYFLLLGIPIVYSLFTTRSILPDINQTSKKRERTVLIIFFVIWFLLLALRKKTVGTDIKIYLSTFKQIADTPWANLFDDTAREYGYRLLCKVISVFTTDEQVFLTIMAFITLAPLLYLYVKESENGLMTIAIFITFLFSMYFSGLRQCIAMGFMAPLYYFTKKKKPIKFIIFALLASLFHQSALVALLFYPIYHLKLTPFKLAIAILIIALSFLFSNQIFSFILKIIGGTYEERYSEIGATGAYSMVALLIIFAVYAFVVPQKNKLSSDVLGLRNILLVSVCLQGFALVNSVAMRMNYYYLLFLPILISKIPLIGKKEDKTILEISVIVIVVVFIGYFFLNAYTGADILQIYPYIPFWD